MATLRWQVRSTGDTAVAGTISPIAPTFGDDVLGQIVATSTNGTLGSMSHGDMAARSVAGRAGCRATRAV